MENEAIPAGWPLYFLAANPRQWMRASLPKFQATAQAALAQATPSRAELLACPWAQRHDYLRACAVREQAKRWAAQTGIPPEDTHFTMIVPIYNEAPSLPSFLATLMLADIPASAHANILLFTNACTDASLALIDEFLACLGPVQEQQLSGVYHDQRLKRTCRVVRRGNLRFIHLDTGTPGKANVLALGNRIARENGHTIAISIDANNYIEPDAISIMFARAQQSFCDQPKAGEIVLMSGAIQKARRASPLAHLFRRADSIEGHFLDINDANAVTGCLMAWNTAWMERVGGPPRVALEDYALGILARSQDYTIASVPEAHIWVYESNTARGVLDTKARYVRGMLQLLTLAAEPAATALIQHDAYFMRDCLARWKYL
ncbi:MAG TPA: glycosyltransferase family 2 protein, partial [Ktedonobacterales bacterium]|nr:glycosyltransferase family 2 protein [Ktedonobacterales bacterium]